MYGRQKHGRGREHTEENNVSDNDRQKTIQNILQNLRNLDGLKRLFWEELNYEREFSTVFAWDILKHAWKRNPEAQAWLRAECGKDRARHETG